MATAEARKVGARRALRASSPRLRQANIGLATVLGVLLAPGLWRWVTQDAHDWAPNEPKAGQEGPSVSARGVQILLARDEKGRKAWEFSAGRIDLSSDKRWATLQNVTRAILFRDGKPYLQMSARHVQFDQQTRDWDAQDELRVSGPNNLHIRSVRASWNQQEQLLQCPEEVWARTKDADIHSSRLVYDARKGELLSGEEVSVDTPNVSAKGSPLKANIKSRVVEMHGVEITIKPQMLSKLGIKH